MTYHEIFSAVKETLKPADTKNFKNDFAVQINIEGEGEGSFYIAFKNGVLEIEPYDYKDRNATIYANSAALIAVSGGKDTFGGLLAKGEIRIDGVVDSGLAEAFEKAEAKKAKSAAKAEAKPTAKAEAKPAVKTEAKTEAKPAAKAEAKAEAKPAAKAEAKAEAKPAPAPAPVGKAARQHNNKHGKHGK